MFNKIKRETNGFVTIEATLSLSAFMFAIVTILTIVNICVVQARISYAINTTAKEISQYSYLYSLTGLNQREREIYDAGENQTQDLKEILSNVNTVYNEIENLGQTGNQSVDDIDDILNAWDGVNSSIDTVSNAGSSIKGSIEKIAKDPKNLLFGIAKIASTEGFDLVKSKLIAAPLAKTMCKRHLTNIKNGDTNQYLKQLGVVPDASGSYIDGLDFSESTLFPYGSSQISINVSYNVKVIALLPIDFTFHFNQTAITHGWLAGEVSFKKPEDNQENSVNYKENETLWTQSTVQERASYIRHLAIMDMIDEGYQKTSDAKTNSVPLYNPKTNEFAMISSMNPLWSAPGEPPLTLDDLSDAALKDSIERLCGKINSTTDGLTKVTTKTEKNGQVTKHENECAGAKNKIVLVIPEDPGLKEKIEDIIAKSKTNGVTIEVVPRYGSGASSTIQESDKGGTDE